MYEYPYLPGEHLHRTESLGFSPLQQRLRALQEERLAWIRMRLAAPSEAGDETDHQVQVENSPLNDLISKFLKSHLLPPIYM